MVAINVSLGGINTSKYKYCFTSKAAPATATETLNVDVVAARLHTTMDDMIVLVDAGTVYKSVGVVAAGLL